MEDQKIIDELLIYFSKIETFDKDSAQDGSALHSYLIELTNITSRANFLMAEYKRKFRQEKEQAYINLAKSRHAEQRYYAPSLARDYIDSQCSETAYIYDLSERLSRTCVHSIDSVRTIVSSLKSERAFANYAQ